MPTESLFPSVFIPNLSLWDFLCERNDKEFPDNKTIFRDVNSDESYSYIDVKQTAVIFGTGLKAVWQWRKGDVLGLFSFNAIDTPAIIWGTHWAGGVVSPANPGYTVNELVFQLKDSGAKALVTQKALLAVATAAAKQVGIPEDRIILLGEDRDETSKFKHFKSIRNIDSTAKFRRTKLDPQKDLAFLIYSSGTTGYPKGVMLSHGNIVANVVMTNTVDPKHLAWNGGENGRGDCLIAFLPFFHIYGLVCLMHQCMYNGLTLVVMPKFDIERFCAAIQNHRITFAHVVPPVVLLLSKHPVVDRYNLSSLRMLSCGAAPLTRELVEAVYERLKVPIKQGYGLSETSPVTHQQTWESWNKAIGSVGFLLPNQTAKFMALDGTELPVGKTGELWIKGPNVFNGYHNNPEGTKNALTDDGYFKTGDVGYQDSDGNFYITDRLKELIKYKGFQVPPAELEGLLITHPKIIDVAVIGVYNDQMATEVPRAYVVLKPGVDNNTETKVDILQWLETKVANHKRLRGGIRFAEKVPKSASGKILRRLLKLKAEDEQRSIKSKL